MNSEVIRYIKEQKMVLKKLVKEGIVKDPALFWSGRMSFHVEMLSMCSPSTMSSRFDFLRACTKEYDRVIFERTT